MSLWLRLGSGNWERYLTLMLLVFMAGFALIPSSKWVNNIFYAFVALPVLVRLVATGGRDAWRNPLLWGWVLFLAWFLVPGIEHQSFQFFKGILYVLLFVVAVSCYMNPELVREHRFTRSLFWFVVAYVVLSAIYVWSSGKYGFGRRVMSLPGRISNPIYVSIWLVGCYGLAAQAWYREKRWIETSVATLVVLASVSFILQSRTGLVGVVFLMGLAWLLLMTRHPRQVLLASLALAVLVGGLGWLMRSDPWLVSLWARADSGRFELLHFMLRDWQACGWWSGCGLGYVSHDLLHGVEPIQHPHNIFVALGIYTGLPALLLFVALMAASLWVAIRRHDPWGMFLAASLIMLNFDGAKLIGNPDELWLLVLMPAAIVAGQAFLDERHRAAQSNGSRSLAT